MATNKVTAKTSGGEKPAPKKVSPRRAEPEVAVSNGPTAAAETKPTTKTKQLPAATVRALKEFEDGELTQYDDADDLFRKLGITLGKA
ncbi:MAG: hypothetical protein ACLQGP_05330 [Isosphaeraceae bacterium]